MAKPEWALALEQDCFDHPPFPTPGWDHGVPACSEECPLHDGKRCAAIGFRKSSGDICEPVAAEMGARMDELERQQARPGGGGVEP